MQRYDAVREPFSEVAVSVAFVEHCSEGGADEVGEGFVKLVRDSVRSRAFA